MMNNGRLGFLLKIAAILGVVAAAFIPELAFATGGYSGGSGIPASSPSFGQMGLNASQSISGIQLAIQGFLYMSGVAMAGGALFKFKAHKDNPQQTPLGTPLVMLGVSAGLLYLPSVIASTGQSIFGGSQNSSKLQYQYGS